MQLGFIILNEFTLNEIGIWGSIIAVIIGLATFFLTKRSIEKKEIITQTTTDVTQTTKHEALAVVLEELKGNYKTQESEIKVMTQNQHGLKNQMTQMNGDIKLANQRLDFLGKGLDEMKEERTSFKRQLDRIEGKISA